jgi:hypothetical protein
MDPVLAVIAPDNMDAKEVLICLIAPGDPLTPSPFIMITSGTVMAAEPFNSKAAPLEIVVFE